MDNGTTQQYIAMSKTLAGLARGLVRDVDPMNDLQFLRIKTRRSEIMIAPEPQTRDKESYLIVVQNEDWNETKVCFEDSQQRKKDVNKTGRFIFAWRRAVESILNLAKVCLHPFQVMWSIYWYWKSSFDFSEIFRAMRSCAMNPQKLSRSMVTTWNE